MKHRRADKNPTICIHELANGGDCTPSAADLAISTEDSLDYCPVEEPSIGDRVAWLGDEGYEWATVKWTGTLPDDDKVQDGETLVGVEFVSTAYTVRQSCIRLASFA